MSNGIPHHISFTPNGNRRKAKQCGIPLEESYSLGAMRALEVVGWSRDIGVHETTLFGLSIENVERRDREELDALQKGAIQFCDDAEKDGIHIHPFGRLHELKDKAEYVALYERLVDLQAREVKPGSFVVHVATNYSGKIEHEIGAFIEELEARGVVEVSKNPMKYLLSGGVPLVDLAIRTGGERRISGLLPFQMSYAELYFSDVLWADFGRAEFDAAIAWYGSQKRNFGK